jgi:hypothetical protein
MGPRKRVIGQCRSRVEGTPLRPLAGTVCVHRRSRKRLPCRRCGQSHWPQPRAGPPQDLSLRHSVEDRCAGGVFTRLRGWETYRLSALLQRPFKWAPSECPFFDRPKRGRKKPHQPALAHCVRVAGQAVLRLTALPRVGAEGHTLAVPLCGAERPRRRTAKGPEKNRLEKERRAGRRYGSFSVRRRKEGRSGEDRYPGLKLGHDPPATGSRRHHPNTRKLQPPNP